LNFYSFDQIKAAGDCRRYSIEVLGLTPKSNPNGENVSFNNPWRPGSDSGAFSVCRDAFFDHVSDEKGGLIDLAAMARYGGDKQQAQQALGEWLRLEPVTRTIRTEKEKPKTKDAKGKTIHPTPDDAARAAIYGLEKIDGIWSETLRHAYRDAQGKIYANVLRCDRQDVKGEKKCPPIHANGNGWSVGDPAKWFPYRFNELEPDGPINVFEGEKCVDAAKSLGVLNAITSSHGALAPDKTDWSCCAGRDVVIHPDNDDEGMTYAQGAARKIQALSPSGRPMLAKVYGDEKGYDVADLIAEKGRDALPVIIDAMMNAEPMPQQAEAQAVNSDDVISAATLLATEPPPPDQIIENVIDRGDKMAAIGSSKSQKSFIIKQLMMAIATGTTFAGLTARTPRRVLYVNLEIRGHHFHRRLIRMARKAGINAELLGKNLFIVNVRDRRGATITTADIEAIAQKIKAEVIVLDPLYKLHEGDENLAADMKPLMKEFDRITEATGAAIVFVHHDPKGSPGDRKGVDRGAGSSVVGRDYDAAIFLTPHRSEIGAVVVEFITRNYAPREPAVIRWDDGAFTLAADLEPSKETSTGSRGGAGTKPLEQFTDRAFKLVVEKPLAAGMFHQRLKSDVGLPEQKARALTQHLIESGTLAKSKRQGMGGIVLIGTPGQIRAMEGP